MLNVEQSCRVLADACSIAQGLSCALTLSHDARLNDRFKSCSDKAMRGHVALQTWQKHNVEVRLTMSLCDLHASSKTLWTFTLASCMLHFRHGMSTTQRNVEVISIMLLYVLSPEHDALMTVSSVNFAAACRCIMLTKAHARQDR